MKVKDFFIWEVTMKYILQRFGRTFFESDSFKDLDDTFRRLIGELTITYMNVGICTDGKQYDVFSCKDGYTLLIRK